MPTCNVDVVSSTRGPELEGALIGTTASGTARPCRFIDEPLKIETRQSLCRDLVSSTAMLAGGPSAGPDLTTLLLQVFVSSQRGPRPVVMKLRGALAGACVVPRIGMQTGIVLRINVMGGRAKRQRKRKRKKRPKFLLNCATHEPCPYICRGHTYLVACGARKLYLSNLPESNWIHTDPGTVTSRYCMELRRCVPCPSPSDVTSAGPPLAVQVRKWPHAQGLGNKHFN